MLVRSYICYTDMFMYMLIKLLCIGLVDFGSSIAAENQAETATEQTSKKRMAEPDEASAESTKKNKLDA